MESRMLIKAGDISFLSKQVFMIKVNGAIKECESIREYLKKNGKLEREDEKLNLIIPSHSGVDIEMKYFLFKGYNDDGSIKPLQKYKLVDGETIVDINKIMMEISVVDIYEKSVYLYNVNKDNKFIEGYIIKDEKKNKTRTLLFSKEKVKVLLKNINNLYSYCEVETFIDKIIL